MEKECCCHKTKERDAKEYKDLCNRLSRIEGQIRGIKGMVEKDAYCVLTFLIRYRQPSQHLTVLRRCS